MSEIAEIINSLENRIEKLFVKIDGLEKKVVVYQNELEKSKTIIENQSEEIILLKSECNSLKISNSLLGSDENKRETKLKINSLIRDIDYCISQLSD